VQKDFCNKIGTTRKRLLRESIPLTGVKRTAMLQRGNANY